MKFNVSSSKLFAQLQAVSRVIAAKNSLQILEAVLFDLEGDVLTLFIYLFLLLFRRPSYITLQLQS